MLSVPGLCQPQCWKAADIMRFIGERFQTRKTSVRQRDVPLIGEVRWAAERALEGRKEGQGAGSLAVSSLRLGSGDLSHSRFKHAEQVDSVSVRGV